ncbi:5760_t:CDS:1 [Funneliformis mosseae]|uniref:5760_t:CDS:1 n=1 Tax=Funneliformis mosseae TaxID=27381 RepID=A0A9N9EIQ6_FUNMO|nr:5760_t:CDS:1 [Funneliformis mosseae]
MEASQLMLRKVAHSRPKSKFTEFKEPEGEHTLTEEDDSSNGEITNKDSWKYNRNTRQGKKCMILLPAKEPKP